MNQSRFGVGVLFGARKESEKKLMENSIQLSGLGGNEEICMLLIFQESCFH